MKKLLALLLALIMVLSLVACGGNETTPDDDDDDRKSSAESNEDNNTDSGSGDTAVPDEITLEYLMSYPTSPEEDFLVLSNGQEGAQWLSDYSGDDEIIVMPETVNGVAITHIEGSMWSNNDPLRAIKLSDSVEYLDRWVFANNENLEIVVFGSGMREICYERKINDMGAVFMNCTNLKQVVLNDGLEIIGEYAFSGCDSLMSIEIPASVTEIDPTAFFAMPEGFTIIGEAGSYAEQYASENGINFQAK